MTNEQKARIPALRESGYSYIQIADEIGVPEGTVKTFCRRNGLTAKQMKAKENMHHCLYCGKEVYQTPGRKEKKFCSDSCRMRWWNGHLENVNRKTLRTFECHYCYKEFLAYESAGRKYCSHNCYIEDRFGGGCNDRG